MCFRVLLCDYSGSRILHSQLMHAAKMVLRFMLCCDAEYFMTLQRYSQGSYAALKVWKKFVIFQSGKKILGLLGWKKKTNFHT